VSAPRADDGRHRLFVAVWPPEEVVAALADLPRPDEPGVRWTRPGTWHVTLRFLGRAEPGVAAEALGDLRHGSVEAVAGPAVHRLGRSVLCVPVAGLDDLAGSVVAATASVGERPDPRPFAGHLTLARLRQRGACRLAGHRIAARWPVTEVTLVRSHLEPAGARYEVLDRVALTLP
jgi:2'-5' RNA ligase